MHIELYKPHKKQTPVHDACNDYSTFFITVNAGRQSGKTALSQQQALFWSLSIPKQTIYWVSPTAGQATKVYKQLLELIVNTPFIISHKGSQGDTEIIFKNKSIIKFRSAAQEDSLRGETIDYLIIDEAAFVKESTFQEILLPMLNVRGKKCLVISTPKGKNWFYKQYNKGFGSDVNYKSFKFTSLENPYSNPAIIQIAKDNLPDILFEQEYLGEFVDSSGVFKNVRELTILNKLEGPEPNRNYYAGIDIGLINDASVVSVIDDGGNLVNYYRFSDIEAPELLDEIVKLNTLWKFKSVVIENNNQGLVIYQDLRRRINNVSEFNTNTKTKAEIINRLIHLFNTKGILLIDDEYLRIELEAFIFKQNDTGHIKFLADYGFHDDVVMALAIGIWAKENKGSGKIEVYKLGV